MVRHINPFEVRCRSAERAAELQVLLSVDIFFVLLYFTVQDIPCNSLVNYSVCEASLVVVMHCSVVHKLNIIIFI